MKKNSIKYIFVVGGVMSSVGKGVAAASIGTILQGKGFKVTAIKIDPYVNVDAGTMNPTEHGEVFVLDDGTECDQDMGNYERFLNLDLSGANYMTTGSVYLSVIQKERNLEYKGRCVHVVPDIPIEVINRIKKAGDITKADLVIVEIGGTVGDYQNILFLDAVRMMKFKNPNDVLLALVGYVPALGTGGNELKTKPIQHAIHFLNGAGLHPDVVLARSKGAIDDKRKEKLEFMCGLEKGSIISAPDVESIYEIPINFEADHLSSFIFKKLGLQSKKQDLKEWRALAKKIKSSQTAVRVAVVGKYFGTGSFFLTDAYISVIESLKHGAYFLGTKPVIEWLDAEKYEKDKSKLSELNDFDGIIVPGGFGKRGTEGMILVADYARRNKIPYLGLCLGMQIMTIAYSRHVLNLSHANSTELDSNTPDPVITTMQDQIEKIKNKNYGATMRLGAYPANLKKGSIAETSYRKSKISERHRHRYEINPKYIDQLEKAGLVFSGKSPDGILMEIAELSKTVHPFYLGTQFHPELKSRPLIPHPLFIAFIKACVSIKK